LTDISTNRDRWLGIELRHFAALAAVASERSFHRAADRLGYVQSAVSRQIAYLEELTGTRLIERKSGPKPVHLTEAGEVLLGHANDILASIDMAKTDLGHLDAGRAGEVRVGFFPGVPTRILLATLALFEARFPRVGIATSEAVNDEPLFELLREGSVDLAFANLPPEPGPFSFWELLRVPWTLLVPADSELAIRGDPPTPADIAGLRLIGPKSARADPWAGSRMAGEPGAPDVVFRSDVPHTVQALVAGGLGAAIMPALAVAEDDPHVAAIPLGDLVPPLSVGVVWLSHRRLTGAVEQFRDAVHDVCAAFVAPDASNGAAVAAPYPATF
jgi:DNA-binding transcriptional LysR family regulator